MKIKNKKLIFRKKESKRVINNILKKVKVKKSFAGLGLFADESIKKGELIIEYTGKILTGKKLEIENENNANMYLFDVHAGKSIDGSGRGNIARYANYSCDPNCESEMLRERIFLRATKDIKNGEEITFDYGEEYFDEFIRAHGCKCNAEVHNV